MTCHPVPNWIFKTALSRDYVHSFDLNGPWYHGLSVALRPLIQGVGFVGACVWSVLGKFHRARVHLGLITYVLNGSINGVLMGCAHLLNGPHPAVGWLPLILGVFSTYMGYTIVWQEKLAFKAMGYCWPPMAISTVIDAVLVHGGTDYLIRIVVTLACVDTIAICLLWTSITIYCACIHRQAWQDVVPDKVAYQEVWRRIVENTQDVEKLKVLALLVATIKQHANLRQTSVDAHVLSSRQVQSIISAQRQEHQLIKSIDQLYLQAHLMTEVLKGKVCDWALQSRGSFPHNAIACSFIKWQDARQDAVLASKIKWASIKRPDRSFEKVYRSYGNDVSRLVDVVRQQIILHTVDDLRECFAAIASDPDTTILRHKNRLSLEYDAVQSAGYRDILLNISIENEHTKFLGTTHHICEVQLTLDLFNVLKTADGHKRYVEYRNKRAQ